jgi:hypothetical protein
MKAPSEVPASEKQLECRIVFLHRAVTRSFFLDASKCDSLPAFLDQVATEVPALAPATLASTTILHKRLSPRCLCLCQETTPGRTFGTRRYVIIGPDDSTAYKTWWIRNVKNGKVASVKIETHIFSREDTAGIELERMGNELEIAGVEGSAPGWLNMDYRRIIAPENSRDVEQDGQVAEVSVHDIDTHRIERSMASVLHFETCASTVSWLPERQKGAVDKF